MTFFTALGMVIVFMLVSYTAALVFYLLLCNMLDDPERMFAAFGVVLLILAILFAKSVLSPKTFDSIIVEENDVSANEIR